MSIVKKLLAMMNTKLNVKSVYGEGSDFSFEVLQQVVKSDEIGDFTERYRKLAEQRSDYHEAFHAPDAHILITDDNAMNLMVVTGLLKRTKIQIDTARSGAETLEKTKEKKYDMIFLDHLMPEMDGIETLKHLYNKGVDLVTIKEALGHKSLSSTMVYVTLGIGNGRTVKSPYDDI